jgi:glyoxylate carboligase
MHKVLNKTQQIGAELVVRSLEMQGVTHVFGVPGAKIDAVFNALPLEDRQSSSLGGLKRHYFALTWSKDETRSL